jgi:hypothetical protein
MRIEPAPFGATIPQVVMQGLHGPANLPYLSRIIISTLPRVPPYCVPNGVRVVSSHPRIRVALSSRSSSFAAPGCPHRVLRIASRTSPVPRRSHTWTAFGLRLFPEPTPPTPAYTSDTSQWWASRRRRSSPPPSSGCCGPAAIPSHCTFTPGL